MRTPMRIAIRACAVSLLTCLCAQTGHAINWTEVPQYFPDWASPSPVEYPCIGFGSVFNPNQPLILGHWVAGGGLWNFTDGGTIDQYGTDGDTGAWASMATDAMGTVHVGFNAEFRRHYAKRVNGVWTVTPIGDRTTSCSPYAESLALDPSNRPTIAAYQACPPSVLVRSFNGVSWDPFDDVIPEPGGWPSLKIDGQGALCVAYVNPSGELRYARRVSGVWTAEDVAPGYPRPSLQLKSDGTPIIAFTGTNAGGTFLRIATRVGGVWQFENLEVAGQDKGIDPDLRLGPQDLPRVTWASSLGTLPSGDLLIDIRYAMKSAQSWTFSDAATFASQAAVADNGVFYAMPKLVINAANDEPHIAYVRYISGSGTTDHMSYLHGTFPPPPPPGGGCGPHCTGGARPGDRGSDGTHIQVLEVRTAGTGSAILIKLSLPSPQAVNCSLFDLAGRLVRGASSEALLSAGVQEIALSGAPSARGIYLLRVQTSAGDHLSKKVYLVGP